MPAGKRRSPTKREVEGARSLCRLLLEIIFPGRCLLCGEPLLLRAQTMHPLCDDCLKRLVPLDGGGCRICHRPLVSESAICTRCRERNYAFTENRSIFAYKGAVKDIIYFYKFENRRRVAPMLAERLAECYSIHYRPRPLVPVPARPQAVRRRGWDPVTVLAGTLQRRYGIPVLRLLVRRGGRAQKSLDFLDRQENLRGAIRLRRLTGPIPDRAVLLDDLFTTGATADACSRVLREAGMREVSVLTLALD